MNSIHIELYYYFMKEICKLMVKHLPSSICFMNLCLLSVTQQHAFFASGIKLSYSSRFLTNSTRILLNHVQYCRNPTSILFFLFHDGDKGFSERY